MRAASLRGSLHLPADKSIAHRALLFNAMGTGTATVTMHSPGADVRSTAAVLATLGAVEPLEDDAVTRYRVTGGGTPEQAALPGTGAVTLDCGNSGTLMRLLAGAATTRAGRAILVGDASLTSRPMERVASPLREMGAAVATTQGHAPIVVDGGRPVGAATRDLPVASAQVLGSLLLAAVAATGTTTLTTPGPTRDHTERLLSWLGADIVRQGNTTRLRGPAAWKARDVNVPGDPSAAAFWLVAGAIHPDAEVKLPNLGLNPTRIGVIRILRRMGALIDIRLGAADSGPEPAGDVTVRSGPRLQAVTLAAEDVADVIDELPVLAVAMAAATGTSSVREAGELRVKESDRIALTVAGLRALGIAAEELADGWRISGAPPRAADPRPADDGGVVIETAGDHRIAMAFAIADACGIGATGCAVDDPACADVSYPGFWQDLATLSGDVR